MKKILNILINKLILKQRNSWIERNLTQPLLLLLLYLTNDKFTFKIFRKHLIKNKTLITICLSLLLLLGLTYRAGQNHSFSAIEYLTFRLNGSYNTINALNADIYHNTNTIEDLTAFFSSREYMKYKVYK